MTFTDDDLKRLRGELQDKRLLDDAPDEELEGLINRLEAAEQIIKIIDQEWSNWVSLNEALSEWRKACGR